MVGKVDGCKLIENTYTTTYDINCSINSDYRIDSGDRLVAFCRPAGRDYWSMIDCDDSNKYYVEIPSSLIPTSQTVAFNGMFSTYSSAYNLDFSDVVDFGAYTVTMQDSETLLLNRINSVASGVGVLLMGNNGSGAYTADVAILDAEQAAPESNLLVGVLEDTVVENQSNSQGINFVFKTAPAVGFYLADGETVPAHSAFMRLPYKATSIPRRFVFGGEEQSGIISIFADYSSDTTIYNLQGIKVDKPGPGLYIIGGKKVIIR